MGFTTIRNTAGREVYACEVEAAGCTYYPCTAHRCPYGWCQRYYICARCWALAETKAKFTKASHERCCINQLEWNARNQERAARLAAGEWLRCSALAIDDGRVHVLFENQAGECIGRYMSHATYDARALLENVSPADFAQYGEVTDAPSAFEDGRVTKQVA